MRRRASLVAAAALVALLALAAWRFLLAGPQTPSEADGQAWLSSFADLLTSPRALGSRGPTALALFPGLGTWPAGDCVTEWARTDTSAPIVTYQRLELGRKPGEPCAEAQFGLLSTTLRASDGITPGTLIDRFTQQFGPPEFHHDWMLRGSLTYTWQVADGIFIHLDEPVGPGRGEAFSLLFVRSYGTPTALATPSQAEQWMDAIVALVTGPDLAKAPAAEAIKMVGLPMTPELRDEDGCPEAYNAVPDKPGPIGSRQELRFDRQPGQACDEARFEAFSMEMWKREPLTAEALVERITRRLGQPAVSRAPGQGGLSYRWSTPFGTAVDLYEGLSGGMQHVMRLRVERA